MSSNSPMFGREIKNLQPPLAAGANNSGSGGVSPSETSPMDAQSNNNGEFGAWPQPEPMEEDPTFEIRRPPTFRAAYLADSRPHTPVETPSPPFAAGSEFDQNQRFGSVSSIATTDDDEGTNIIYYPWNEQQDELVKSMYEELLNMPQLTPFSGRYPPSGVLHRVAKNTVRMAKHRKLYFPHSMNAVRQRVIYLYHNEQESNPDLEKYRLPNDYFSVPLSENIPSIPIDSEEFVFTDAMGPISRRQSIEDKYSRSGSLASLQPPFRESIAVSKEQQQPATEEDVINIVAKRKRDSLRMKRGPH